MKNMYIKNFIICSTLVLTMGAMTDSFAQTNSSKILQGGPGVYCSQYNNGGTPWQLKLTLTPDNSGTGPIVPIRGDLNGPEWYGLGFYGCTMNVAYTNGQYVLTCPGDPVTGRSFTLSGDLNNQKTVTVSSSAPVCNDPEDWTTDNCNNGPSCFSTKNAQKALK